jgi:hypothetical protein
MLNDDQSRRNDLNLRNDVGNRDKIGATIIGVLAVAGVIAAVFMWAPWRGDSSSGSNSPGTTVGSLPTIRRLMSRQNHQFRARRPQRARAPRGVRNAFHYR